jgi:hypothetical protein
LLARAAFMRAPRVLESSCCRGGHEEALTRAERGEKRREGREARLRRAPCSHALLQGPSHLELRSSFARGSSTTDTVSRT